MVEALEERWCPAISLVQNIGTANGTGTQNIPVTTAVKAGDAIIVEVAFGGPTCTVADSAGNVYTRDVIGGGRGDGGFIAIFSALHVKAIPAGGHITLTTADGVIASAQEFSGLAASNALDQTSSASGSNANPSSGFTGTTRQANELLIGAIFSVPNPPTFNMGAGYTALPAVIFQIDGQGGQTISPEFQVVTSTGSYQANGTLTASPIAWVADIATFATTPISRGLHFGQ
jgi:hypothetical protein